MSWFIEFCGISLVSFSIGDSREVSFFSIHIGTAEKKKSPEMVSRDNENVTGRDIKVHVQAWVMRKDNGFIPAHKTSIGKKTKVKKKEINALKCSLQPAPQDRIETLSLFLSLRKCRPQSQRRQYPFLCDFVGNMSALLQRNSTHDSVQGMSKDHINSGALEVVGLGTIMISIHEVHRCINGNEGQIYLPRRPSDDILQLVFLS